MGLALLTAGTTSWTGGHALADVGGGTRDLSYGPGLFSESGAGVVELGEQTTVAGAVAQSDGKILYADESGTVTRLLSNGLADPTYGVAGTVTVAVSGDVVRVKRQPLALQPDGKLLLVGSSYPSGGDGDGPGIAFLARLDTDGTPDASFGTGGVLELPQGDDSGLERLAVQGDRILVTASGSVGTFPASVLRLLPDGSPDTAFGVNGTATFEGLPQGFEYPFDLELLPDGRIVVSFHKNGYGLTRLTADGALDASFGTAGVVLLSDRVEEIAIDAGGGILAWGADYDETYSLSRFQPDGTLDTGFGIGGSLSGNAREMNIALGDGGEIYLAREVLVSSNPDLELTRLLPDGTVEASFGQGGTSTWGQSGFMTLLPGAGRLTVISHREHVAIFTEEPVQATQDFGGTPGLAFATNGAAAIEQAALRLTPALQGQVGSGISDVVAPAPVDSFHASFDFWMGGGNGADGISFNLLDASVHDATALFGENGPGIGALTVTLRRYAAGGVNEVSLSIDGQVLGTVPVGFQLDSGQWHRAEVSLQGGAFGLRLTGAGEPSEFPFQGLAVPSFTPSLARIGFGGRTGIDTNEHRVDNVALTVTHQFAPSPWSDLGYALAGKNGTPRLAGFGCLAAGSSYAITLWDAHENSAAFLVYGMSELFLPFLGGTLVPSPDVVVDQLTGAGGGFTILSTFASAAAGSAGTAQVWTVDPTAAQLVSASNALRIQAP
ncbi:MAG: hypothetical protein AAF682_02765 [Planctomycetota bacterium]